MEKKYQYEGLPLTNTILIKLIPELFSNNKAIYAMDILDETIKYHLNNGGKSYNSKYDKSYLIKFISGALNALRKKGLASTIPGARGWWNIKKEISITNEKEILIENIEPLIIPVTTDEIIIEATFGVGAYYVYAYYFPRDKERAILKKERFFPIKIGKTKEDVVKRVLEQTSASSHETPVIALVIKTDHYNELERLIHGILKMRKRKVDKIKGDEWFNTDSSEIDSIYSFLTQDVID